MVLEVIGDWNWVREAPREGSEGSVQKSAQGGKQRGFRGVVRSNYLPKEANKVDNNVPRRPPEGAI